MLTLEERERRAYIEGRVEEAALLAFTLDTESERVDELEHEVRMLKSEIAELELQLAECDE